MSMEEKKKIPLSPLADLQHQTELLKMEYEYERAEYEERSGKTSIEKKIEKGICWYPVSLGRSYYNALNQYVVELSRNNDEEDIEHSFEYGRTVCFFTVNENGSLQLFNIHSTISYVKDNTMVVVLPDMSTLTRLSSTGENLGVQLYFDETTYKLMFGALKQTISAKDNRLAALRDILLGTAPATQHEMFPIRFPWLNISQEEAVNHVLAAKDVAVVHGPPGTGKTTTLVEAIFETIRREPQVLVCAQSNTAVDWISEKLNDRGANILRIGNPTRVNDKMLSFTYERRFEAHPDYAELWAARKEVREIRKCLHNREAKDRKKVSNRLAQLKERINELTFQIDNDLFSQARVIACTLAGSANRVMEGHHFASLFIDEAAQALEAACWIAIGKADKVILAGDHFQLPPTIKCYEAERAGLGRTLMEKIVKKHPENVSLLTMQYRMNEEIMAFPSHWFYKGTLQAAPTVAHRGILNYDTSMIWLDTTGADFTEESPGAGSMSRINRKEAELLMTQLKAYIEKITIERILDEQISFGIISPYRSQVQYLRSLVRGDIFFRPLRKLITVHTVDGFQGQERDVIMLSLVRANDNGHIGFLNELRRMNVAITRTRMKLVVIGDASTLTQHKFYKELYDYITKKGKIISYICDLITDNSNDNEI